MRVEWGKYMYVYVPMFLVYRLNIYVFITIYNSSSIIHKSAYVIKDELIPKTRLNLRFD